jgi:HSP20 family protein
MASTLTRWDPFLDLAEMRSRFDRLLEDFGGRERAWAPAVDVVRQDDALVVHADVPGLKPEEIKIEVRDGYLFVTGEHEETKEEKDKEFVRRERHHGSFSRSVQLPDGVDPKKIKARTHDGVLEVTIPLPKEASKETVTITPTGE